MEEVGERERERDKIIKDRIAKGERNIIREEGEDNGEN